MKFTFTEKKMDSSEDLRAYAIRKISKLDRFFKNEAEAFVTFSLERGRFRAEITLNSNGTYYRASELTSDMYASVDSGVAAIERQIRRNKTRLEKRLREGVLEKETVASFAPAEEEPADEFKIVRNKRFSIKPMSAEEAILQMNLLDHEFFVFRNMDADDAIAVVYKRRQGGYGLICDDGLEED
ncbi:MAG: ribosome-associated translation inhibitor RaiA [Oscillospiraceae bacterium]|nr:ribosome-associated translation inhibitor RaiA [Oscillospiraceae bacterium]MBR0393062.1 ribosome-associated translation inhibitor RaiA [Oscillospiraceae bacterium]